MKKVRTKRQKAQKYRKSDSKKSDYLTKSPNLFSLRNFLIWTDWSVNILFLRVSPNFLLYKIEYFSEDMVFSAKFCFDKSSFSELREGHGLIISFGKFFSGKFILPIY